MTFPSGTIETLLIGANPDSFYTYPVECAEFDLHNQAMVGNLRHGGVTTVADVRAPAFRRRQDEVLNRQSVSIVGAEDLDAIAGQIGIDEELALEGLLHRFHADRVSGVASQSLGYLSTLERVEDVPGGINRLFLAQCLGANVVVGDFQGTDDIPNFRSLERGMDLGPFDDDAGKFRAGGAAVMVTRPNAPCIGPGELIESVYGAKADGVGFAEEFVRAGQGRRGFVGMISKGGEMAVGQAIRFVPYGERVSISKDQA